MATLNREKKSKEKLSIDIPAWKGPLDLLLELIKANDININDIPINEITSQYLQTIKAMQRLEIEVAAEFLVMAAELIHIKSKMLLPTDMTDADDQEFSDPRNDLVSKLIEYQKFKNLAQTLESQKLHSNRLIERQDNQLSFLKTTEQDEQNVWKEVSLFELIKVFSEIAGVIDKDKLDTLEEDEYLIEDKKEHILAKLEKEREINFYDLFKKKSSKVEVIVTFWAILDLYKFDKISIKQHSLFGDIYIFLREGHL